MRNRLVVSASFIALGACAGQPGGSGSGLAMKVVPLTLPGLTDACYTLTVANASGTVWQQADLCADQYGDGTGAISYVGTCDASADQDTDTGTAGTQNSVTLELQALYTGDPKVALVDPTDFVNPCPVGDGCIIQADCDENADTSVVFNLAIMRSAKQGFFDVAVNFEDIFCSAKFDSCYDGGVPIELLFGDDTDTDTANADGDALGDERGRDHTGVFAMACTAGTEDTVQTDLLLGDVVVTCGETSFTLPTTGATGNHTVSADVDGDGTTDLVQYATYSGTEALDCGDGAGSCHKAYFNLAIDLEDLPEGCHLSLQASAQDANAPTFELGRLITTPGQGTTYPYIDVAAADLSPSACVQDGLDDGGSVSTFYGSTTLGGTAGALLCAHVLDGASAARVPGRAMQRSLPAASAATLVSSAMIGSRAQLSVTLTDNDSYAIKIGALATATATFYNPDAMEPTATGCGTYPAGLTLDDGSPLAPGQSRTVTIDASPFDASELGGELVLVVLDDQGGTHDIVIAR